MEFFVVMLQRLDSAHVEVVAYRTDEALHALVLRALSILTDDSGTEA